MHEICLRQWKESHDALDLFSATQIYYPNYTFQKVNCTYLQKLTNDNNSPLNSITILMATSCGQAASELHVG